MMGTGPASVEVILPYFSLRLPARTRTMRVCSPANGADTVTTPASSNDAGNGNNLYSVRPASRGQSSVSATNTVSADRIAARSMNTTTLSTVGVNRTDPATDYVNIPTVLK
jgi:hypothetical protein